MTQDQRIVTVALMASLVIFAALIVPNVVKEQNDFTPAEELSDKYMETMNVGNINLTSIEGVTIKPYVDGTGWAQARYTKGSKFILDLYQMESTTLLDSGKSMTQEFCKALHEHFDYPEDVKLEGDANFDSFAVTYVLDDAKTKHTIVAMFMKNKSQYLILEISKLPLDEDVEETLQLDIRHYTDYKIPYDLNDIQDMKKVRTTK